jgi:hypothetical protein
MVGLLVVLIILGCVAYQYLKGKLIKSFAVVITSICAAVVAFGYFELLANVFISRKILVLWAQPLSFVLLFILAFAVLQTIAAQLTRQSIDFGLLPERIGRVVCGIFLGLIISGLLLTAAAMAPISAKYPYQRFDAVSPNPEEPDKVLLNADGFVTGWFSIISSGSFSGKRSFATLHPDFLNQLFLNRHEIARMVPIITSPEAIRIPNKKAVWPAPEGLKDSNGRPVLPKSGHNLTIVRVGITTKVIQEGGLFTPSQLRLICKQESGAKDPLTGKGKNVYPVGYLETADRLQMKRLTDHIRIERSALRGGVKEIDFAFYVPDGFVPVLVEFKQNSINQLPPPVTYDQAPPPVPFTQLSERARDTAEPEPNPKPSDTSQTVGETAGRETDQEPEP